MPGFSTGGRQLINDQRQTSSSSKVWAMWVGWLLVSLALLLSPAAVLAQGQYTASALYNFCPQSGCPDGGNPTSPPLFDTHGNIYGVANVGGANHQGVVYQLTPNGGTWSESVLYSFCPQSGCPDGKDPYYPLVIDSQGNLYGTTIQGGSFNGGVVYELSPVGGGLSGWTESVIYNICSPNPCPGGSQFYGGLTIDTHGNLYGVALVGGTHNSAGTVFELSPSGGSWTFTVLYEFCTLTNCTDGLQPKGAPIFDSHGNLYGTTTGGGANNAGVVYELSPSGGGSWTYNVLYNFCPVSGCNDGQEPVNALVFDAQGNLYGDAGAGGANPPYGGVFELSPAGGGSWTEQLLASFCPGPTCPNGYGPMGVAIDSHGDVFGNTAFGGNNGANRGTVFELTPGSGGQFTYNIIYTFCPMENCSNQGGGEPLAGVTLDAQGNVYGANAAGGLHSEGAVYELSPPQLIPTTTVLRTAPNPSNLGQTVTMTATVTAQDHSLPTGNVTFESNGVQIGSASLNGSGVAVLVYAGLNAGTDSIVATYGGSGTLAGSTSNTVMQVVHPASSTTAVTSSLNPSTFGESVTITATVSPAGPPAPTGTVSFTSNAVAISGCTAVPLTSQLTAVCTTSALAVGTDAIVATYSGDTNYSGSSGGLSQLVNPTPSPLQFVAVTPCRLVDTRPPNGSGPIVGGTSQNFPIPQEGGCNIPTSAAAYSLNVSVVPQHALGYLTIWPAGEGRPVVATLNSLDGRIKADAAIVPAGANGAVSIYVTDTTNVILDINGYFAPVSGSTLAFYPLAPCRVADTRHSGYPQGLGPPYLTGLHERDFPILNATTCNIPASGVAAYSLNFSVVPHGPLGYMTVWPTGQTRPLVSTLNDLPAQIIANAAIVPAGSSGEVSVFPSSDTDLIIDINGYFAAPGAGGLSLYPTAPCRVIDTRHVGNGQPFSGTLNPPVNVSGSFCGPPATAQAYVFNATVVPTGELGYLTLWPDGTGRPTVSTLNALDGSITNNMAIVPSSNGKVDAYASGITQLILDISSYFAP